MSRKNFETFISDATEILLPQKGLEDQDAKNMNNSALVAIKLNDELIFGCRFALNDKRANKLKESAEKFKIEIK